MMLFMMKKILLLFAILIVMSLSPIHVWAMGERPAVCSDFVMIEVGNHLFKVPREMILSVEMHESEIRQLYKKCHIQKLRAEGFSTGNVSIYDVQAKPDARTTYDVSRAKIEKHWKEVVTLEDGLKKLSGVGSSFFYFLPQDIVPTGNGQPVTFACFGRDVEEDPTEQISNFCRTWYIHPSGLRLQYHFYKSGRVNSMQYSESVLYSDNEIIAFHVRVLKRVEEMIIPASEDVLDEGRK